MGGHLLDKIVLVEKSEQLPIPVQRRPRRERYQRRIESKPHLIEVIDNPDNIFLGDGLCPAW